MNYLKTKIANHVEKVKCWNPIIEIPKEKFNYIDLSSIDKDSKQVDENLVLRILGEDAPSRARQVINTDDVIISTVRPNLNGVAILKRNFKNGTVSTGYCVLRTRSTLDPKYLFYWVQTKSFINDMINKASGASYPAVSDKIIKDSIIPLPPLSTQKHIAAILDAADLYRQKTKTLVAKYDQLAQSLFLEMFGDPVTNPKGWEKTNMNRLCSFKKESILPENIKKSTKYIGLECIEKETGNILDINEVTEGELKSNKFVFDENYILYGKLRPYLNKVALPNFNGICSTDIIPIKPIKDKSNRQFICQIMRSKGFVSFAHERSSGANLPRISPNEIEKYPIINPPISLQTQFASRIQLIEAQKQQALAALQKSETLFNSLLQRAFKGELVAE